MELESALRQRGHRITTPRRRVWGALVESGSHLTAEEIANRIESGAVNLSSVYRTLGLLVELGLVRESNLGTDETMRWEVAHPDEHFHLVCRQCGEVDHHIGDLVEQVRHHLKDGHGFRAEDIELVVTGLCADCA